MTGVWSSCQQILRNELSDQDYNAWIRHLHASESDQQLDLYAPNPFVEEHIREHFLPLVEQIVVEITDHNYAIELQVASAPTKKSKRNGKQQPSSEPIHFENNLNPFLTFENFIEGKSTQLAHAASRQVADNPGGSYNPLFIHGSTGLGKTHLMHSIGHHLLKNIPSSRILYIRSQNFVNDMVSALRHNKIDQFKKYFHSLDVLLIDDI
ncbi:MAG: ATP-binding protein, partial [Gammaproteobacteria bacterium]|nr:ATP-binding protein [Gammaproteobacteria bacterium]MBT5372033.1 ATP-binding protein [Gammaproteobacteria bacterium]